MVRLVALIALAVALAPASAQAATCDEVAAYPGDAAAQTAIAQWMAYGASTAGLPRELPVMGALVESGLRNLPLDNDRAGYFQMRNSIWNGVAAYAGFADNPALQLKWFVDQAVRVRADRISAGTPDPTGTESAWGEWAADALLPPENLRYRYQERLADARALAGAPCTTAPPAGTPPPPPPPPAADATAPLAAIAGASAQRALRRGAIVLDVRCPDEPCTTSATATIALPGARRALRIALGSRTMAAGATRRLRFALNRTVRARLRAALRRRPSVQAAVRIVVRDLAGNAAVRTRTVRLTR